jgi:Uma2 family endonuclease
MSATLAACMTAEDLLAVPDDGVDRELIQGQLKEKPMTVRNRFHTRAVTNLAYRLKDWLERRPQPRGEVHTGEVGCVLRRDPDTLVGIDVAYLSAEVMARQTENTTLIEGPPTLAVEVLSPSDRTEDIRDKVLEYLAAGVPLIWIVDPYFRTITVHRPSKRPKMFNDGETLSGDATLPDFEIAVATLV